MKRTAQLWTLGAGLVAAAFALRTLSLIDATALWSDELYSVGKSFQPSPGALLDMLRQDTHPPFITYCSGSGGSCWDRPPSACGCSPGWPTWLGVP